MRRHSAEWNAFWDQHVQQFVKSQLSYRQYAAQHGLGYRQLHRQVHQRLGEQAPRSPYAVRRREQLANEDTLAELEAEHKFHTVRAQNLAKRISALKAQLEAVVK